MNGERGVPELVVSGRSVLRSLADVALRDWRDDLHGIVLDLGSGDAQEEHGGWVRRRISIDIGHRPEVIADATACLPFKDACSDVVDISWFLYIAPDPLAVLREAHRVLRPGGVVHLSVPLVFPVTPEPDDLWRFTGPGLERLGREAGFASSAVIELGGRWTSALYLLDPFVRPRSLRPWLARVCVWLDGWTGRRYGHRIAPHPVGYCTRYVR